MSFNTRGYHAGRIKLSSTKCRNAIKSLSNKSSHAYPPVLKNATLGLPTHSTTTTIATAWLLKTPAQIDSVKPQTTYRNSSNYNENKIPLHIIIMVHQGTCTESTPNHLWKIQIQLPKSSSNAHIRTNYRKNHSRTSIKKLNRKTFITYRFSPMSYRQYQHRKNSINPNIPINLSKTTLNTNSSKATLQVNSSKPTPIPIKSLKAKLKLPPIHSITCFQAVS
jgi:hypothetical protein